MAFATVPAGDYLLESGAPVGRFASSETGERAFCARCGTPLFMQDRAEPATLDFSLATLDSPDAIAPGFHIYYASRIAWADAADDLPRFAGARKDG